MTVNGVGTSSAAGALYDISQLFSTQNTTALAGGTDATGAAPATGDSARISGPGKLLGELQQLAAQDPTKFKSVAADIASKLQTAATQATGAPADLLTALANKFQTASSTGSASGLVPAHHHHHHAGAYNPSGQAVAASVASAPVTGVDLQQLFNSISTEVAQAVGA